MSQPNTSYLDGASSWRWARPAFHQALARIGLQSRAHERRILAPHGSPDFELREGGVAATRDQSEDVLGARRDRRLRSINSANSKRQARRVSRMTYAGARRSRRAVTQLRLGNHTTGPARGLLRSARNCPAAVAGCRSDWPGHESHAKPAHYRGADRDKRLLLTR